MIGNVVDGKMFVFDTQKIRVLRFSSSWGVVCHQEKIVASGG
jgi:hypothetical protein